MSYRLKRFTTEALAREVLRRVVYGGEGDKVLATVAHEMTGVAEPSPEELAEALESLAGVGPAWSTEELEDYAQRAHAAGNALVDLAERITSDLDAAAMRAAGTEDLAPAPEPEPEPPAKPKPAPKRAPRKPAAKGKRKPAAKGKRKPAAKGKRKAPAKPDPEKAARAAAALEALEAAEKTEEPKPAPKVDPEKAARAAAALEALEAAEKTEQPTAEVQAPAELPAPETDAEGNAEGAEGAPEAG